MPVLLFFYILIVLCLSIYSWNSLWLTYRCWRTRHEGAPTPPMQETPLVTVQLPVFNEFHVVERLLAAVAALDYPRDRLEIQVLDDSTDETTALVRTLVDRYRQQGLDITLLHRQERTGYKAGALAEGLRRAKGEFLAIFDADFVPPADWLRRTVPHLVARPELGLVQTRWTHLNATYSPLTMAQAIILDGQFGVEHRARNRSGYLMNFNGTGGIWRRAAIEAAGGWSAATLTEDLDLSYRAQLAGWRVLYLPEVTVPAELPPQMAAYCAQQFRWAKGSAQCLRRLAGPLWRSPYPLMVRWQGLLHISTYLCYPLMLLFLLLNLPVIWWQISLPHILGGFSIATLGPLALFITAQILTAAGQPQELPWWRRIAYLPVALLLGSGIMVSATRGVIEGLLGRPSPFQRTPKFRVESRQDSWRQRRYRAPLSPDLGGTAGLALYVLSLMALSWLRHSWWTLPFLALYEAGFLLVLGMSLWQHLQLRPRPSPRRPRGLRSAPQFATRK